VSLVNPVIYPGAGIAVKPEPIDWSDVLFPKLSLVPYSYQYIVGAPLGVTRPVTTTEVSVGITVSLVKLIGGTGVCADGIVPSSPDGEEVALMSVVVLLPPIPYKRYALTSNTTTTTPPTIAVVLSIKFIEKILLT
jgi:hypothetical protein